MKAQNRNNASRRTRAAIKTEFARMLAEKKELGNISVTELCQRAGLSRGAFYSHYDDVYAVAQDYEDELIDRFFSNDCLRSPGDAEQFLEVFFSYLKENDENYRLLCRSNDFLFAAGKLTSLAAGKILELCHHDPRIRDRQDLELEIRLFLDGFLCQYVRYCRGYSATGPEELYAFTRRQLARFIARRNAPEQEAAHEA